MKKIHSILFVLSALFLASCEKESEGVSKTTTYCTFEMSGNAILFHEEGTPFTDPGCIGYEGETEVPVSVKTNLNVEEPGAYTIVYTATNSDGFSASTTREVLVYYPNMDIAGIWSANITRTDLQNDVTAKRGPYSLALIPLTENSFYLPDLLGGWYWYGQGYGFAYAFQADIQIESNNSLTILSTEKSAWGSVGQFVTNSVTPTIDTTTGTIHFVSKMSDNNRYLFDVTLKKQ